MCGRRAVPHGVYPSFQLSSPYLGISIPKKKTNNLAKFRTLLGARRHDRDDQPHGDDARHHAQKSTPHDQTETLFIAAPLRPRPRPAAPPAPGWRPSLCRER